MSEFTSQLLPILLMYGFVLALAPFIAFAMWLAFDGDAARAAAMRAATGEPELEAATTPTTAVDPATPQPALSARDAASAA